MGFDAKAFAAAFMEDQARQINTRVAEAREYKRELKEKAEEGKSKITQLRQLGNLAKSEIARLRALGFEDKHSMQLLRLDLKVCLTCLCLLKKKQQDVTLHQGKSLMNMK